ncbi:6-pyruvoyl-tetrahydropterin synthase-related protein [Enterococcus mundtii]|uniref:6-pyruvoyl-tetrahydropterin synthase-related protein n=1 Tax=Enterococcus mundtii TaxID=53346 RepID=UPI00115AD6E3|nr:6-pyruvoyl-tetrahydropterin synthase-related protein [Enterococcus mundtii]
MKKNKYQLIDIMFILCLSMMYVLPLFLTHGILHNSSQDTYFHLSRLVGLDNVWDSPVNFNNFAHHGTMINVFYPWLTFYPASFFFKITGNLVLSYNLYYFFITFLTMLIAYFSMNKLKRNRYIALLFSIIYTFAGYRAIDIFFRASLGEAVALTFLPLILVGCYEIYVGDYSKWYWLTIGMTLVVYTHLLSVAMVTGFIAITIILSFYFWNNKMSRLLSLLKATTVTFLLSAAFLIPFIQQSSAQELKVPQGRELIGMAPSDMLSHILNNNYKNFTIGLLIFIGILVTCTFIKKLQIFDKFIYAMGIITLFCSTSLFPWQLLNSTPIKNLQFVWRLNGFTSLFLAYTISILIYYNLYNKKNMIKIISVTLIGITLHFSGIINLVANNDSLTRIEPENAISAAENYQHTDYANKESIKYPDVINNHKYFLNNEEIKPETSFTNSKYTIKVDNKNNEKSVFTTSLYHYDGQIATVNNTPVETSLSSIGTTELVIPPGKNTIVITYTYTNLAIFARYISLISLMIFLIFLLYNSYKTKLGSHYTHITNDIF